MQCIEVSHTENRSAVLCTMEALIDINVRNTPFFSSHVSKTTDFIGRNAPDKIFLTFILGYIRVYPKLLQILQKLTFDTSPCIGNNIWFAI